MRIRLICCTCALAVLWALPAAASTTGSGWSIQRTPNPIGTKASWLSSVSCASSRACTAVGGFGHGPLAERWNGTGWKIQHTPKLSDRDELSDVSCPSASVCTAVGLTFSQPGGLPLVERWNGDRWVTQTTPGAESGTLLGVSCIPAHACVAVGYHYPHGAQLPLIERWGGRRWVKQPMPAPRYASLSGVSCVSARACTAVGKQANAHTRDAVPLVERWNGVRWSIQPAPGINGDDVSLDGVSCTTARLCIAVGQDTLPPPCESTGCGEYIHTRTLAERWNGRKWSIQRTPNPTNYSSFSAVSCTTSRACTAIGDTPGALAERWDGHRWTVQHTIRRVRGRSALLSGLVCASGSDCLAVGDSGDPGSGSGSRTLVERWRR